jgi:hypothetical protein
MGMGTNIPRWQKSGTVNNLGAGRGMEKIPSDNPRPIDIPMH